MLLLGFDLLYLVFFCSISIFLDNSIERNNGMKI